MELDIKKSWLSVARRLQSVGKSNGLSVVSIRVLVNSSGDAIAWTEPKQTLIEPKSLKFADPQAIKALFALTDEQVNDNFI